jgi:hypothetical protein
MRYFMCLLSVIPLLAYAEQKSIELVLPIKKMHEECIDMKPGQTLQYGFEASAELDFNLHYHQGKDVSYPAKGNYSKYSNTYTAQQMNAFCLMWTNKSGAQVTLQTTYQLD